MGNKTALRQAGLFFMLTLGLSYLVFWGPLAILKIPAASFVRGERGPTWAIILFIAGGFVPSLVGIALTWKQEGSAGLRRMWQSTIHFKIGGRWYLAAILTVLACTLGQLAIIRWLGYSFDLSLFITQLPSAIPLLILGPLSEELGWRGYALDRLQSSWNALASSVVVGIGWAFWHLPLFGIPGTSQNVLKIPFLGFVTGLIALSILYTWLHNNTNGVIWTAIFFHWIGTYAGQVVSSGVVRSPLYNLLEFVPYYLAALVIVIVYKPKRLSRPREG